jgi:hypothetical protein
MERNGTTLPLLFTHVTADIWLPRTSVINIRPHARNHSSAPCSYRHAEPLLSRKLQYFSHHVTLTIRSHTVVVLRCTVSMKQARQICHRIITTQKDNERKFGVFKMRDFTYQVIIKLICYTYSSRNESLYFTSFRSKMPGDQRVGKAAHKETYTAQTVARCLGCYVGNVFGLHSACVCPTPKLVTRAKSTDRSRPLHFPTVYFPSPRNKDEIKAGERCILHSKCLCNVNL